MKKCWEIKKCAASRYETSCLAFKSNKNCWEVEGTMCKVNHGNDICKSCEVMLQRKLETDEESE